MYSINIYIYNPFIRFSIKMFRLGKLDTAMRGTLINNIFYLHSISTRLKTTTRVEVQDVGRWKSGKRITHWALPWSLLHGLLNQRVEVNGPVLMTRKKTRLDSKGARDRVWIDKHYVILSRVCRLHHLYPSGCVENRPLEIGFQSSAQYPKIRFGHPNRATCFEIEPVA